MMTFPYIPIGDPVKPDHKATRVFEAFVGLTNLLSSWPKQRKFINLDEARWNDNDWSLLFIKPGSPHKVKEISWKDKLNPWAGLRGQTVVKGVADDPSEEAEKGMPPRYAMSWAWVDNPTVKDPEERQSASEVRTGGVWVGLYLKDSSDDANIALYLQDHPYMGLTL